MEDDGIVAEVLTLKRLIINEDHLLSGGGRGTNRTMPGEYPGACARHLDLLAVPPVAGGDQGRRNHLTQPGLYAWSSTQPLLPPVPGRPLAGPAGG